jgi:thioredoxin reductase
MIGTVDVVIAGDDGAVRAAAARALQRGQRVLVVLRSADARATRRLRRALRRSISTGGGQLSVIGDAEVVCVDGVDRVEAVVVRHAPTGRLSAVNAAAFLSCVDRRSRVLTDERE